MTGQRIVLRFAATRQGFAETFAGLCDALDAWALPATPRYGVELVFEELVANIVRYGSTDARTPTVRVILDRQPRQIVIAIEDDGPAFDPRGSPAPAHPSSLEDAKIGGFGLMLVQRAARSLDYVRTPTGLNRVVVTIDCAPTER